MDIEALRKIGQEIEQKAYNPLGLIQDGVPYDLNQGYDNFIRQVQTMLGGPDEMEQEIIKLNGDPGCGNWLLVTALKVIGIPLRMEPDGSFKDNWRELYTIRD